MWMLKYLLIFGLLTLHLCLPVPDEVSVLVIGDWGGKESHPYSSAIQRAVAQQMANTAKLTKPQFVISTGDNIYFHGVTNEDDRRFKSTFEDVYSQEELKSLPWYLVAGNHDYWGDVEAQMKYSQKSHRWNFPGYNYTIRMQFGMSQMITFVMLDTVRLCGISDLHYLGQPPQGPKPDHISWVQNTWLWLEDLFRSEHRSDYLLVVGHYPALSLGYHGPTKCLVDQLMPLMHKYNVSAYLSGHEHTLQHLSSLKKNWTIEHFVVGAGALINIHKQKKSILPPGSKSHFFWANRNELGGFASLTADRYSMNMTFISGRGQDIYFRTVIPRFKRDFSQIPAM